MDALNNNGIEDSVAPPIEPETNDNTIVIQNPFNPNDVKVYTQPLTLGDIIERLEYHELKLDSEFQRRPDLWDNIKKSRLIESILLRLPIPTFYFDGSNDNKWEVIDGLQRISTLRSFVINKTLVLENLQFLKHLEGKTYDQLPREFQRRIKTFPITVYVLEKGTPDEVKYNIFSRLNQGGLVLTPQELRNALHQGVAANVIADLVRGRDEEYYGDDEQKYTKSATEEGRLFVQVTEARIPTLRMEDRDFATRFVAFYLIDYNEYTPDMDTFLTKGMRKISDLSEQAIEKLKQDFRKSLNLAREIFGNDAFRKSRRANGGRFPINKALFESITVNFAKLSEEECATLIERKELLLDKFVALQNEQDGRFLKSLTQSTASSANVTLRFSSIQRIITETLEGQ